MVKQREALLISFTDTPEIRLRREGEMLVCVLRYQDETGNAHVQVQGREQVMVDFMLDIKNAYEKLNGGGIVT